MAICSATGFPIVHQVSLGSFIFLTLSTMFLSQFGLVNCVPENYYNPDYNENTFPGFDVYGNWGDFIPTEDNYYNALDAAAAAAGTTGGTESASATATDILNLKRHLGALASKSSSRQAGFMGLRSHRSELGFGGGDDEGNFGRFVRGGGGDGSWRSPFSRFGENKQAQSNFGIPMMKNKRFLGTLARGGWFPRQFRGYVDSSNGGQWEKRHVGSAVKNGMKSFRLHSGSKRDFFDGEVHHGGRFEHDS